MRHLNQRMQDFSYFWIGELKSTDGYRAANIFCLPGKEVRVWEYQRFLWGQVVSTETQSEHGCRWACSSSFGLPDCLHGTFMLCKRVPGRKAKEWDQMACSLKHVPGFNSPLLGWLYSVMCPLRRQTKQAVLPCNFSKLFAWNTADKKPSPWLAVAR